MWFRDVKNERVEEESHELVFFGFLLNITNLLSQLLQGILIV